MAKTMRLLLVIFLLSSVSFCYGFWGSKKAKPTAAKVAEPEEPAGISKPSIKDSDDWIDPQQMFSLDQDVPAVPAPVAIKGTKGAVAEKECAPFCAASNRKSELIMLRHSLRKFIDVFREQAGKGSDKMDVSLHLEQKEIDELERLLDSESTQTPRSDLVLQIWGRMQKTIHASQEPVGLDRLARLLGFRLELILYVLLIVAFSFAILHLERSLHMSLTAMVVRAFKWFLLLSFVVSFPWTWLRLYQEKVADQERHIIQSANAKCKVESTGKIVKRILYSIFSIKHQPSPCEEYYRAVNVHPFLDVPPTQAIVTTVTHFVLEPVKHLGAALGQFFQAVLAPLPFYLWAPILVFLLLTAFMFIITKSNYSIQVPFLLKIQPVHPPPATNQLTNTSLAGRAYDRFLGEGAGDGRGDERRLAGSPSGSRERMIGYDMRGGVRRRKPAPGGSWVRKAKMHSRKREYEDFRDGQDFEEAGV